LTLNQIGYLKNLRIPFVRRAENECLTTTIAAHLTASDATAFIRWSDDLICFSRRHLDALEGLFFGMEYQGATLWM